jgi:Trk K+ transport system NAD-binding subunit
MAQAEGNAGGPVVLCGLGRVGQAILRLLVLAGRDVSVISAAEPGNPAEPLPAGGSVRFLVGDARDERLLEEAGLLGASALVAATDDDLANLAIALHARTAAPDVPVVVRLFDQDLASHLRETIGVRAAFSASALSAPAFVAAALGDSTVTSFEAGGETWVVEEVLEAGSGQAIIREGAGGTVVLARRRRAAAAPPGQKGAAFLRGVHGAWEDMPRGLRFAVFAMLVLIATSIGLFRVVLHLPLVDAWYFVVTTITTTGYGDISLHGAPAWVKVYGTLVMISGCALFAVLFSVVTDVLLRTRLGDVMARGAARTRGHVVVAGIGNVGIRALRELVRHGEQTVAVQKDADGPFGAVARTLAPVVVGDAGAVETLCRAGVPGAKTVLALTNDDLTNLSVAVASRRLNPSCRIVARIFDRALAGKVSHSLGIDAVLSQAEAAAPTFVAAALDPDAVRGFLLGDCLMMVVHRKEGGSPGPDERVLAVRGRGEASFRLLRPGEAADGGETIAVRWTGLRQEGSVREVRSGSDG